MKEKQKYILINLNTGFGNKVNDVFISLFIKDKYGYDVYFVLNQSKHNKLNDPKVSEVFPLLKNEIHFIKNDNLNKYKVQIELQPDLKELPNLLNYNTISLNTWKLYPSIQYIYKNISHKYNNLFSFNMSIIKNNSFKNYILNDTYGVIHIRYGDKLRYGCKSLSKNIYQYLLNTPEYYYQQINYLKSINSDMPIFILTDSFPLVKKFIIEHYHLENDKKIIFTDIPFVYSYFLLLNTSYFVLSNSTFAYTAYMLSTKYKLAIFSSLPLNECKRIGVSDPFILDSNKKNIMIYDKKYILNYNQKLLYKMYNYNKQITNSMK